MPFHISFSSYLRLSRRSRRHGKAFPWTRVPSCTTQCGTGGISRRCCFERRRRARSSRTRSCTSRNASGPSARICDPAKIPRSGSPHHPTSWREFNLLFRPGSGRRWLHGMQPSAAEAPLPSVGGKKCIAAGSVVAAICAPTSVDNYREFADPGHSTHLPCRAGHGALFSGTRSHGSIARNFYLGRNAVKTSILKCGFDHEDKYLESMKEEQSEDLRTSAASRSDVPGAREHSSKGMV